MQIRSKFESDGDPESVQLVRAGPGAPFDGAAGRSAMASRDIIAALLLTVAAALFIAAAATGTGSPDARRIEAADTAANPAR